MVKQIIKEAMDRNPIGLKEALEEELRSRIALALEAKMKKEEDEMDDEDEDEDMEESFDLSDYTVEELKDFMMSEDFEQLDEISKKKLASYIKKAKTDVAGKAYQLGAKDPLKPKASWSKTMSRERNIDKAVDRLTKESYDEDELDEAKGGKPFFGVKEGKAYAVNLPNAKGGNEPRNMGWLMDNNSIIKEFMKDAKKHYVDAKGKATLPAVKKAVKMLGAKEFYASWKADSPSYKDDSFPLYYKD